MSCPTCFVGECLIEWLYGDWYSCLFCGHQWEDE